MATLKLFSCGDLTARTGRPTRSSATCGTSKRYVVRIHAIRLKDEPKIYADPPGAAADRFAEDRQYLRNDAVQALAVTRSKEDHANHEHSQRSVEPANAS